MHQLIDYKWLYSLLQNKIERGTIRQLEDETQVSAFETPEEYKQYFDRKRWISWKFGQQ
jgi:ATP-dependent Clp protease ATP-binding subunit ClpB